MLIDMSFRSTVPAEAEEFIAQVYRRPQLRETGKPFHFQQSTRGDERVNVTRFQVSSKATLTVALDDVVGIGHLRDGDYRATSNGDPVDPSSPFVLRPGEARSWSERLDLTMINLDLDALGQYALASGVTSKTLLFPRVAAKSPASSLNWQRTVVHATDVLRDDNLLRNDLIRRSVTDLVFSSALAAFVGPQSEDRTSASAQPAVIARAVQFINDNAQTPISVIDIAQAARLSVRGTEAAFKRTLGITPSAHLRAVRLARAHADLGAADPTTDTVAAIARRWGFTHLGRFAAAYRERFGRLPSDDLRE